MSTQTRTINRSTKPFPLAGLLVVAALLLGYAVVLASQVLPVQHTIGQVGPGLLRGRMADSMRYTGMAARFAAAESANLQRAQAADSARYTAAAASFSAGEAARLEIARSADAARWNAMLKHFTAREIASTDRGRLADAARWNAMAAYYSAWNAAQK